MHQSIPTKTRISLKVLKHWLSYGVKFDERLVLRLVLDEKEGVHLHLPNYESLHIGFLFCRPLPEPSSINKSLISQLGFNTAESPDGTKMAAVPSYRGTNVPGTLVAGDTGAPRAQVTIAMAIGMFVTACVSHFVNRHDDQIALNRWREQKDVNEEN